MKALARTIGVFILSILVFNTSLAQKASFTTNGGLIIGFGAGMAYQKSDLANSKGFGFDFILGSQLYKKENAFLSVDWKFRFLAGENKAYDHRINPDGTYSNIRYSFFNYDLELGLTLNRLRERTRIVVTGFAGAGITHGRTFTDLYDAGNSLYDYSSIDPNRESKLVYEDLRALSDGDFETRLVNKAAILPTAGLFIGYQLSRSLTLGIEFKTNFYLTEKNSLVGIDLDNRVIAGSGLDRNNYVSLGISWNLRGGSSHNSAAGNNSTGATKQHRTNNVNTDPNPNTSKTDNRVVTASLPRPLVNITNPSADTYHTDTYTHTIRATVNNVNGPDNISFYQNGFPNNNFTYNVTTKIFTANVSLRDGENNIRIKAVNRISAAEDLVTITFDHPRESVIPAPEVGFTSPSGKQITSSSDRIDVTASVKNISSKQDIQLTKNGSNTPFEYNPGSGLVKTSVMLTNGDNKLLIKGFNESGSAQDQLIVYFKNPEKIALPTVRFINPAYPVNVRNIRFPLSAETQNVRGQNDVSLKLNGASIGNFSFSANGTVSVNLLLLDGVNTIEITAKNEAGSASERTSITYNKPVVRSSPPVINIISPVTDQVRTYEPYEELRATVLNVNTKEDIILNINGSNTGNFNFNNSTKVLTTRVVLRDGNNVLTINAQNESGGDFKDQVFIKETRPCPPPVIRLIDPAQGQTNTNQQTYALKAEVHNITNSNQLRLIVNGKTVSFSFINNLVSSSVPLIRGLNILSLNAINTCGVDNASVRITNIPSVEKDPCTPPKVSFTVNEVNREDATHELRGSISGVKNKADISLTVNGRADNGFRFVPATGDLSARIKLKPGSHTIVVSVINNCGTDSKSVNLNRKRPCTPPKVSFTVNEVNRNDATHELRGSISGVKNKADISFTVNGKAHDGFQFVPATDDLSARFKLTPGSHTIAISVKNACGTDSKSVTVNKEEPCTLPKLSFTVNEVNRNDATHELRGSISGVKNKADISLTVNGRVDNGFQFTPATGDLSTKFKLTPGSHTIVVSVKNACGEDSKSESVTVEEEACGLRINPGNSTWQFCMITPSGTFSRDNLTNTNFSYSGPATSLYFMPIGGGGDVMVNGSPYAIRSGQYYLFTGKLNVTVSTKNPGSMGHWSVCISANREPLSGNGNNRPKSPCEEETDDSSKGKGKKR